MTVRAYDPAAAPVARGIFGDRITLCDKSYDALSGADALAVGGDVLMNAMFWTPGLVVDGAIGAAHLGGAAVEVVGSAAEGVFSTILEFIGSLFDN